MYSKFLRMERPMYRCMLTEDIYVYFLNTHKILFFLNADVRSFVITSVRLYVRSTSTGIFSHWLCQQIFRNFEFQSIERTKIDEGK